MDSTTSIKNDDPNKTKSISAPFELNRNESATYPPIPGYEITRELGHGGMGIVYEAIDLKLKRHVAIKIPIQASLTSSSERKRFQTEAEAIAQLSHPNIVKIHEIGEHQGCPYICMQLLKGGTFVDRVRKQSRPLNYLIKVMEIVAKALQHAHDRGIIHRDLKPSNIMFDENDEPFIVDFGLAKLTLSEKYTNLTTVLGTPAYMSPEQVKGKMEDVTTKTDIYSFGAILYELLTGKTPSQRDTPFEIMQAIDKEEIQYPSTLNKKVDRELEAVCMKCLTYEASNRYQTANDVGSELTRWLEGKPTVQRPFSLTWRIRRKLKSNVILAITILFVVFMTSVLPAATINSLYTHKGGRYSFREDEHGQLIQDVYPLFYFYNRTVSPLLAGYWHVILITCGIVLFFAEKLIIRRDFSVKKCAVLSISLALISAFVAQIAGFVQVAIILKTNDVSFTKEEDAISLALDQNPVSIQKKIVAHISNDLYFVKYIKQIAKGAPDEYLLNLYLHYADVKRIVGLQEAIFNSIVLLVLFNIAFHVPICLCAGLINSRIRKSYNNSRITYFKLSWVFLLGVLAFTIAYLMVHGKFDGMVSGEWYPAVFSFSVGIAIFNIVCVLSNVRTPLVPIFTGLLILGFVARLMYPI